MTVSQSEFVGRDSALRCPRTPQRGVPIICVPLSRKSKLNGADDEIRTRDLRFTKPLLYQLSYVGAGSGEDYIRELRGQARSCWQKLQIPSSNIHPAMRDKPQHPKRVACCFGISVIGISMELGCWCLVLCSSIRKTRVLRRPDDNYVGSTKVWPISRSAMRSGSRCSAVSKRSIGSRNGSKLRRKV